MARTLIIPCGGRKNLCEKPRYLTRHPNGMLLLEWCMAGICPQSFDRIIAVLLQSDVDMYSADKVLMRELEKEYPLEVVVLPKETAGPADTVYQAITTAKVTGPVVVKDVDNHVLVPSECIVWGNFVAGLDLNLWERDIHNLRSKSFLLLNEQGNLLDIIEKQIRSDVICLGLYGFKRAEDFVDAYHKLNDASYPITKLYVSHIISYLIGYYGTVFRYVASAAFEDWSDKRHWSELQNNRAMYFLDLDGVNAVGKLQELQKRGANFVGYTVKDKIAGKQVVETLKMGGISLLEVIYNCPWSGVKRILETNMDLDHRLLEL